MGSVSLIHKDEELVSSFVPIPCGLQPEDGSQMTFTPDTNARGIFGNHDGGLRIAGACIFNCNEDSRDTCEGFTEFICEEEQIFKVTQDRHQTERGFSKMRPTPPTTRACRNARKTLNVQGNCCWKIYQRYRYAGDMRIIRGSRTFDLYFVPRSMKIMPC